ncbi:hypothetical protein DM02DRAFT_515161 [Periconia macrospinosa]|uniref:DUF2306 domain-containing protein n=1 Tax=Periconia macrospinosa TaxID=97972 RepID=A0A2V1EAD9_9PLEO|nr:hypothetical protein DM02DRAFT_515161 [Periconia macrospinosa]
MTTPTRPPANRFVAITRKAYNLLGFSKGYNFLYFCIFGGALLGFCLARLPLIDINGYMCGGGPGGTLPGECYYYVKSKVAEWGIRIHLIGVLPAGILAFFQFIPIIRYKAILFHRINGYLSILLVLLGIAGALMIARHSVGGSLDVQAAIGLMGIVVVIELGLAWWNIKRLRIDRHRAFMIRAWALLGAPITTRLILFIAAQIITSMNMVYLVRPCAQIEYMLESTEMLVELYSECASYANGSMPEQQAIVEAGFNDGRPDQIGAALGGAFGMSIWLAMALHAACAEIYLQCTPKEAVRLREVSHQRRLEAGYSTTEEDCSSAQFPQ